MASGALGHRPGNHSAGHGWDTAGVVNVFDAVLFDFHGTLISSRAHESWVAQACVRLGHSVRRDGGPHVTPARLVEGLSSVWRLARGRDPECLWDLSAEAHRAAFVTVLTEDLGCPRELAQAMYDVLPDQWELFDEAVGVLTDLSEGGLVLGVVSNIGIDIRPRLDALGILALVDSVVLSFEVGVKKPDARIFAHALGELGSSPARTLMVGDTWDQDGGAAALGIRTLILPDRGERARGLLSVSDICLTPDRGSWEGQARP